MRQLVATGHMPHLLRQLCAAFLVRDLRIPWRWGAEFFELHLLDHTPDANYGNWGYRILPIAQLQPLARAHLTSLELLSWPVVHDPLLEYIKKWVPELRDVAARHGAVAAREPWRLANGYAKTERLDVTPRRDSPLWVMSVNRVHWPEYQQMMTGAAHLVRFAPASDDCVHAEHCPDYPPPCVPPVELEILYDRVPVDNSWGGAAGATHTAGGTAANTTVGAGSLRNDAAAEPPAPPPPPHPTATPARKSARNRSHRQRGKLSRVQHDLG